MDVPSSLAFAFKRLWSAPSTSKRTSFFLLAMVASFVCDMYRYLGRSVKCGFRLTRKYCGRKNHRMTQPNTFQSLLSVDVSKWVEKKGKFSYLSWSYAVAELMKHAPDATWSVCRFPLPDAGHVLAPYCQTPTGFFVEVAVTVGGKTLSQIHPVIDERNQTIANPKADQINKSIMRCLVKAIALHGLGLNIYAGEDLPLDDGASEPPTPPPQARPTIADWSDMQRRSVSLAESIIYDFREAKDLAYAASQIDEICDDSDAGKAIASAVSALIGEAASKAASVPPPALDDRTAKLVAKIKGYVEEYRAHKKKAGG